MAFFRAVFPMKPPRPSSVEKTNVGESESEQAMISNYEVRVVCTLVSSTLASFSLEGYISMQI